MNLRVTALCLSITLLSSGCASTLRVVKQERITRPMEYEGRQVRIAYFRDVAPVKQEAPDLCWAACMEQALALQGVVTTQQKLVEEAQLKGDRSIDPFWWNQTLNITRQQLKDGTEVWAAADLDGGMFGPILLEKTLTNKLVFELFNHRIPIVCTTDGSGGGHCVNVVGMAFEKGAQSSDDVIAFLLFDPMTAAPRLETPARLLARLSSVVYVTTYLTGTGAAQRRSFDAYGVR